MSSRLVKSYDSMMSVYFSEAFNKLVSNLSAIWSHLAEYLPQTSYFDTTNEIMKR